MAPNPPTLSPYRNTSGIGYTSEKLNKMVGNSASYSKIVAFSHILNGSKPPYTLTL